MRNPGLAAGETLDGLLVHAAGLRGGGLSGVFSGISGAALLIPVFLIGFPLLGVPCLTTVAAVGTSLFLETSGFGMGVARYLRMRLVDTSTARTIIAVTLPLGAAGAVAARHAPVDLLRLAYGAAMVGLAWLLSRQGDEQQEREPSPALFASSDRVPRAVPGRRGPVGAGGEWNGVPVLRPRARRAAGAQRRRRLCRRSDLHRCRRGHAAIPGRRSHFPVAVAAATSTVIVAGTVVGASATHLLQLTLEGGLGAVPWDLLVWAVPGALVGAVLGTRLQGRVSERVTRRFFTGLFAVIGVTFLLAFTVFRGRFA